MHVSRHNQNHLSTADDIDRLDAGSTTLQLCYLSVIVFLLFQVQILYRLLTLEYEELISLGFFGPVLTMTGMLVNIYSFFQLFINQKRDEHTLESHADQFSMQGLLSLMAQQIVLPFCYLYYFTAFTCWLALWER